jgi:uncharacterized protein
MRRPIPVCRVSAYDDHAPAVKGRRGRVPRCARVIPPEEMQMASNKQDTDKGSKQSGTSTRGFASMDPDRQREIASEGGKAAHEKGTAHEFTSEEARRAGSMSHGNRQSETASGSKQGGQGGSKSGSMDKDKEKDKK